MLRIHICGDVRVEGTEEHGSGSPLAGRQGRLAFAYLVGERHRTVSREELADVLWPVELPPSWTTSLSAIVSKLRRFLSDLGLEGQTALASTPTGYRLNLPDDTWVDVEDAADAVGRGEQALVERDAAAALVAALQAREIAALDFTLDESAWGQDFRSRLRDLLVRAIHVQAESILLAGDAKRAVVPAEEAIAIEPFREAGYRLLMRAYAAAGERALALRTWERCRELLSGELGTDPAPETESVYLEILRAADETGLPTGVITFLVSDIERSSELWETKPAEMNSALEAHDAAIRDVVSRHGGQVIKGLGDGMFAVFRRATGAASAALALRDHFAEGDLRVRFAMHTGEAFERDGDYFGPTVNRVSRMSDVAFAGQILASQATVEVLRDQNVPIRDLGVYELKGLSRAEHVYEIGVEDEPAADTGARERPAVPSALDGAGPFVGRSDELDALADAWERAKNGNPRAVLLSGEPGVGKTRLSGECSRRAYDDGALVLYGRCDEDLAAPYQPFAQAARTIVDYWGPSRLRALPGIEEIVRLVPEIATLVPGLPSPTRGEPEEERYVLLDALARLFVATSADVPIVLVLDDLHWAAKPTLLLLRHLLRFAAHARLLIVGTYRDTELDRAHPLAGVLVDLHRDEVIDRISLSGLEVDEVAEYATATGHDDVRLHRALADVTSGLPFFMIEVLRHIEESGGKWDARTLPQGVKEATGRRLSHLSPEANDSLLVAAVSGSVFSLDLVERVSERECVDDIEEARHAGLVLESDAVGQYRFAHAYVRQVLLSEVATVKRVRLHLKIAAALEETDADEAELAHHYFECAWAGHAAKAAEYCARAADRAMERLAYEEANDLYDKALQSMDVEPEAFADERRAELLLSRCEAALAAGDIAASTASVESLRLVAQGNRRLTARATTFAGELAILVHPDRLRETERAVSAAAQELAEIGDLSGASQAHAVHAMCLFRLGRVAECETLLDAALTEARAADDHRRVNAMLAQAPVAAMYGPSPVPRAGGRCLDIVRQLRITTGSPAVEAVAIRCQAVLESLRGRTEAARRMIDNARTMLEQLGHRVGLLEVDLFAGLVELVAGDPEEAERLLRNAYDGFVVLGLDADAAHAAARLARACVRLGRMDEAYELTEASERLGGDSPESAVVWRCARAEVLAHRGEFVEARRVGEEAVAMAEGTDKPSEQWMANMALATVHRAAGDERAARAAAEKAAMVAERKGAIALVENARTFAGEAAPSIAPDRADTESGVPDNACSLVLKSWRTEYGWDAFAPDHALDLLRFPMYRGLFHAGDERRLESLRDMGLERAEVTVFATRGEQLALVRMVLIGTDPTNGGSFEIAGLNIHRLNDDGLIDLTIAFEEDDLDGAFAELDELFIVGEGAEHADVLRAILLRDRALEDVVFTDHRAGGFATVATQDAHDRRHASARELVPDWAIQNVAFLEVDAHGAIALQRAEGTTDDGSPYEWTMLCVVGVQDGKRRSIDIYPVEAREEAFARFAALAAATRPLENSATRAAGRFRQAVTSGRWDAAAAALTDDFTMEVSARTPNALYATRDKAAYIEWLGAEEDSWGRVEHSATTIATRGDLLCLSRVTRTNRGDVADGFETDVLVIHEVDDDGLIKSTVGFAPNHLDAAFDELDARYLAGEGAPYADVYRLAATSWSGHTFFVDHRPGGFGVAASQEQFDRLRASREELMPGGKTRVSAVVAIDERAAVLLHVVSTDQEYEWRFLRVSVVEGSRLARVEIFEPDAVDQALARFAALGADRLENACTRVCDRVRHLSRGQRWDEVVELVDPELDWRFPPPAGAHASGRDGWLEQLQAIGASWGWTIPRSEECVAIRGERLALLRRVMARSDDPDGFMSEWLHVREIGENDRLIAAIAFEAEELEEAFAELDRRWLAGEGAQFADVYRAITSTGWQPDTLVDHRSGGFGTVTSPDEITRLFPGDSRSRVRIVSVPVIDEHGAVLRFDRSTGRDDAPYEWQLIRVFLVRGGRVTRAEIFEAEDIDSALERFDALRASSLENASSRVGERLAAAADAQRWDDAAELISDDFTWTTPLQATSRNDKEAFIEVLRVTPEVWGDVQAVVTVLAIRGERLSLIRRTLERADESAGAFSRDSLAVREISEDGLVSSLAYFDGDDLDAAYRELNARYLAGEGREFADVYRMVSTDRSPDSIFVDHRKSLVPPAETIEDHSRRVAAMRELTTSFGFRAVNVLALAAHGAVSHMRDEAVTADGSTYDWEHVTLVEVRNGVRTRLELFDLADRDVALARFAALGTNGLENESTRVSDAISEAILAGRWDDVAELLSDDFEWQMPSTPGMVHAPDKAGFLAWNRAGDTSWGRIRRTDVRVAIRGERLSISRRIIAQDSESGYVLERLSVREIDEHGCMRAIIFFEPDDFDGAFDELDRRYHAGEGKDVAALEAGHPLRRPLHRDRDWDAYRAICADDLIVVDHRPGGWGTIVGADALIEHSRTLVDLAPDVQFYASAIHRVTANGSLRRLLMTSAPGSGGAIETEFLALARFAGPPADRRFVRLENFPLEDLDRALERFEELEGPSAELENAASRMGRRLRALIAAGDFDAVASLIADDAEFRHATHPARFPGSGKESYIDWIRAGGEVWGEIERSSQIIAIRGDRLSLGRLTATRADDAGYSNQYLGIRELDENGRVAAMIYFDADDLDLALEELDRRYEAGEGAPHAQTLRAMREWARLYRARDWDELSDTYAEDITVNDHRLGGLGTLRGRETWLESQQAMVDLTPDSTWYWSEIYAISEAGHLVRVTRAATNETGGDVLSEFITLVRYRDGVRNHTEIFDVDQLAEAKRRFEELDRTAPPLENAATRIGRRGRELLTAGDIDAFADLLASDFRTESRSAHALEKSVTKQGYIDWHRAGKDVWGDMVRTSGTIAIRGDRLSLTWFRGDAPDGSGFTRENLIVRELDEHGLVKASVYFDIEDLDAALEELDTRYEKIAGVPVPWARSRTGGDSMRLSTRDWDQVAERYTQDLVVHDHRPGGFGRLHGRDEWMRYLQTMTDVASEAVWYYSDIYASNDRGHLSRLTRVATTESGLEALTDQINIVRYRNGLRYIVEVFDLDQFDEARRRFEELETAEPPLENAATRIGHRARELLVAGDVDVYANLLASDFTMESRSSHPLLRTATKDEQVEWVRAAGNTWGEMVRTSGTIAIRGDRLSLTWFRGDAPDGSGFMRENLIVRELDEHGLVKALVYFDRDDLDAALDELDRRYAEGEGAPHARTLDSMRDWMRMYNARDWDGMAATYAEDITVHDRRRGGFGTMRGRAAWLDYQRTMVDLTSDVTAYSSAIYAMSERGHLVRFTFAATNQSGGDVLSEEISLFRYRDGVRYLVELYDVDQLDVAKQRFEELERAQPAELFAAREKLENAATRHHVDVGEAIRRGDFERLAALFAPDFVAERRIAGDIVPARMDVSEFVEWCRRGAYADFNEVSSGGARLAIRGDTLGLFEVQVKTDNEPGAFTYSVLLVREVTPDGLGKAAVYFAEDDVDAAFEELESRYRAGEGAPYADTWRVIATNIAEHNARDWERLADTYADDLRVTVRYPNETTLTDGTFDKEGMVQFLRAGVDMAHDRRLSAPVIYAISEGAVAALIRASGTTPEGTPWDVEYQVAFEVRDGQLRRFDVFPSERLDEALATYEEFAAPKTRLENTVTRLLERRDAADVHRDWDAVRALHDRDFHVVDRRKGAAFEHRGPVPDERLEPKVYDDLGVRWEPPRVLAVRGDRLALRHHRGVAGDNPGAPEVEWITVFEAEESGRLSSSVRFDPDDLGAAFAELDRRYLAGEGAEHADVLGAYISQMAALNARDLDAYRAGIADDFVSRDHRFGPLPDADRDESVRATEELFALLPQAFVGVAQVHAIGRHSLCAEVVSYATDVQGSPVEWTFVVVYSYRDGRAVSRDMFALEDLDDALALYEQLEASLS